MPLFGADFGEDEKEDVLTVIKNLSFPCYNCRLGYCQKPKANKGLIWRGNPSARIALVSIMPGPKEMETGQALTGKSGLLADSWFELVGLNTNKDMFVINIVQCKPPDVEKTEGGEKRWSQREPELDEIAACFPSRCLRILKAMPNLEVVVILGWQAAAYILGGSPRENTHMGHWYTTSLLPGKAVFCLSHPASLLRKMGDTEEDGKGSEEDDEKLASDAYLQEKYKVAKCLQRFRDLYLNSDKIMDLVKGGANED